MNSRSRRILSPAKKAILWIVFLVIAWNVLLSTPVLEAVFSFCFGGVVPGTAVILSPDTVITISASVLGCIVLLCIGIPILRRHRHPRDEYIESSDPVYDDSGAQEVMASTVKEITPPANKTIKKPGLAILGAGIRQYVSSWIVAILKALQNQRLMQWLKPYLLSCLRFLKQCTTAVQAHALCYWPVFTLMCKNALRFICAKLAWGYRQSYRAIVWLTIWAGRQCKALWRWAEPYLWQFDGWLAVRAQAFKIKVGKKLSRNESLKTITAMFGQIKRTTAIIFKEFQPAALWTSIKLQLDKFKNQD